MKSSILVFAVFCSVMPGSQAADMADQQLIHQQARQQALEAQLAPPPADVRLSVPEKAVSSTFPVETPCFPITRVWTGKPRRSRKGSRCIWQWIMAKWAAGAVKPYSVNTWRGVPWAGAAA
ncbi:hypothetical protein [Photorhabdus tasmaniensis]|uniref:hypothetical protein n=1 Tax=Photorhabdus tasmaniensis TaxID=1004159 RepID=UPI0026D898C2